MSVQDCGCVNSGNGAYTDWGAVANQYNNNQSSGYTGICPPAYYDGMTYTDGLFDNSTFANTYGGMYGGLGCLGNYGFGYGGMYGMMPYGPYGMGNQNYYDWMMQNQQFNMDYNRRSVEMQRNNDININSPQEGVDAKMGILTDKIQKDDQRHIAKAFEDFVEAFGRVYPEADPDLLRKRAIAYYNAQGAIRTGDPSFTIAKELRQYGKPIFVRKLINWATCGLFAKGSAEETIANLTHSDMSDRDQNQASAGKAAGVVTGLSGTLAIFKGRNVIWKAAKKQPIVVGILAIGAAVGLISSVTSD